MPIDKLINLINEHLRDEGNIGFPRISESLPAKFQIQKSDIPEIDQEWVWQVNDQFDCYYGELAYLLDDGKFLIFEFNG